MKRALHHMQTLHWYGFIYDKELQLIYKEAHL
jgi:hypothetical protein